MACAALGAAPELVRHDKDASQPSWSDDLLDINAYVSLVRGFGYSLDSSATVAKQMELQAGLDMSGVHRNLLTCARMGVAALAGIKQALLVALEGLEGLLREAEGASDEEWRLVDDGKSSGGVSHARIAAQLVKDGGGRLLCRRTG